MNRERASIGGAFEAFAISLGGIGKPKRGSGLARGAVVFDRQRPEQVPRPPSLGTRVSEGRVVRIIPSGLGAAGLVSLNFLGGDG